GQERLQVRGSPVMTHAISSVLSPTKYGPGHQKVATRNALPQAGDGGIMQVEVSPEAARLVRELGGRLWVWAARPRRGCWGTPTYMHAATEPPAGLSGFRLAPQTGQDEVEVWFRAPAGRIPDVLEIGVRGRRRPRVEAYWDACRIAM